MTGRVRAILVALALAAAIAAGSAQAVGSDMLAIAPPADITVAATTPCGQSYCAQVNYSYSITGGQPPYSLICNLASGSLFLVGSHAISCFGQDSADNSTPPSTFTITVTGGGPPPPPPPPPRRSRSRRRPTSPWPRPLRAGRATARRSTTPTRSPAANRPTA